MFQRCPQSAGHFLAVAFALAAAPCAAATVEIRVLDERGAPLPDVAVHLTPADGAAAAPAAPAEAVMDQHDQQFNPHLLIVQAGTAVRFPNNDVVSHHVYSFSQAKPFELGLYKGNVYPPVVFDKPGLVVVGCNIHDGMLAYILVVDTPYFAVTDEHGIARVEVPAGNYSFETWTPRARPANLPSAERIAVGGTAAAAATVSIGGRLAPPHDHGSSSLSWRHY